MIASCNFNRHYDRGCVLGINRVLEQVDYAVILETVGALARVVTMRSERSEVEPVRFPGAGR
jgi:hypothetical protein